MEFKNDLGKPWRYEEDGCTVTRTCAWSAPGCHPVGCGLKVYVRDGKVVRWKEMRTIPSLRDACACAAWR